MFGLNQLRLLVLFYAFRGNRPLFESLHGLVLPLALIAATAGLFLAVLNGDARRRGMVGAGRPVGRVI